MVMEPSRVECLIQQGERRRGLGNREAEWAVQAIEHLVTMIDEGRAQWPDEGLVRDWCVRAFEPGRVEAVVAYVVGAVDLEVNR